MRPKLVLRPRRTKLCLFLAVLSGAGVFAQTPAPRTEPPPPAYVRRLSVGVTLSVLGLNPVSDRSLGIISESPVSESQHTTTGASQRIGYGVRVQLGLTERFAVDASAFCGGSGTR